MLCCSNVKKKSVQKTQNKLNKNQNSLQTLNINDEALTFNTTTQIQNINTIQTYKFTQDLQTIRSSRSNSRGTKNNDRVAQVALIKPVRKTPFQIFYKKGTLTSTKYLSKKQGYTFLITTTSQ